MAGEPHLETDFHGGSPMGLWDDSKLTSDFKGGFRTIGGSIPAEGHHFEDGYTKPEGNPPAGNFFSLGVTSDPNGIGKFVDRS